MTASKENPGHGFANTKRAVCFSTYDKLIDFLNERQNWDLSAKRITRKEAMKHLEPYYGERGQKGLDLDHWYKHGQEPKMVLLWQSSLF